MADSGRKATYCGNGMQFSEMPREEEDATVRRGLEKISGKEPLGDTKGAEL